MSLWSLGALWRAKEDKDQALAFRVWLVESGTVAVPDEVHLRTTIDTLENE